VKGKTAITHLYRTDLACKQMEGGVPYMEVNVHQGWEKSTSADIYLRGAFKPVAAYPAVGWDDMKSYYCWRESEGRGIPPELLRQVLPGLDRLQAKAQRVVDKVRSSCTCFFCTENI
jgi:hypothetical protein